MESRNLDAPDPFRRVKLVRRHFPAHDEQSAATFWTKHYYIAEIGDWRLIVLNTAFEHRNETTAMRGSVATETLSAIEADIAARDARPVQIAMMHHHPVIHADIGMTQDDVMLNGDDVLDVLAKSGVGLVIHGHKHRARTSHVFTSGHHVTIFGAGSFSCGLPPRLGSNVRNMFHLIELEEPQNLGATLTGRVRTWQFGYAVGWRPATLDAAGMPHFSGFGAERGVAAIAEDVVNGFDGSQEDWHDVETRVPDLRHLPSDALQELLEQVEGSGLQVFQARDGSYRSLLYREKP